MVWIFSELVLFVSCTSTALYSCCRMVATCLDFDSSALPWCGVSIISVMNWLDPPWISVRVLVEYWLNSGVFMLMQVFSFGNINRQVSRIDICYFFMVKFVTIHCCIGPWLWNICRCWAWLLVNRLCSTACWAVGCVTWLNSEGGAL